MKVLAIASLAAAAAGLAHATPVERQGVTFPAACNTACADFIPIYNTCDGATDVSACIKGQGLCNASWFDLGSCLTCWSLETGVSNLDYWVYFVGLCA